MYTCLFGHFVWINREDWIVFRLPRLLASLVCWQLVDTLNLWSFSCCFAYSSLSKHITVDIWSFKSEEGRGRRVDFSGACLKIYSWHILPDASRIGLLNQCTICKWVFREVCHSNRNIHPEPCRPYHFRFCIYPKHGVVVVIIFIPQWRIVSG